MTRTLHAAESVTEGHPDKLADQISDAVLDSFLAHDPFSRVACETYLTADLAVIGGEVSSKAHIDVISILKDVIREAGYTSREVGFDPNGCTLIAALHQQSPDIAQGVAHALEERLGRPRDELDDFGAGDMSIAYGYACDETPECMPMPIVLAHRLASRLAEVRKNGTLPYLRPDGKVQVTLLYENSRPIGVNSIVMAAQHKPDVDVDKTMHPEIIETVLRPIVPPQMIDYKSLRFFLNTTGKFVAGGPAADTGLSGRKPAVDTYGGMTRHGGSSLSGKDATKVDRSGAYAARHVAKNIVAAGLAERCEVQISYAIGVAHPADLSVETFGTEKIGRGHLEELVERVFDLRPEAIIRNLDLRRPIFRKTATYGHFGRDLPEFTWERTDKVEMLRKAA